MALIGHGIGAGILVNGKLLRGSVNGAGEWGHTKVTVGGRTCACGSVDCLEALVGGGAIVRRWLETGGEPAPTEDESLAQLIEAADDGDPSASSVVDETVRLLGVGLANLINLFNPAQIVIGGWAGLQLLAARRSEIHHSARSASLRRQGSQFSLEASNLEQDAVALGAALLPLEQVIEGNLKVARVA